MGRMFKRWLISTDRLGLLLRGKEALHYERDFHCMAVIQLKKTAYHEAFSTNLKKLVVRMPLMSV